MYIGFKFQNIRVLLELRLLHLVSGRKPLKCGETQEMRQVDSLILVQIFHSLLSL